MERLGVVVHAGDGELVPRTLRVLAGEHEGALRLVREIDVDPRLLCPRGAYEVRVLSDFDSASAVVRLCLISGSAAGHVRLRGITLRMHSLVLGGATAGSGALPVAGPERRGGSSGDGQEGGDVGACAWKRVEVSTNKGAKKYLTDGRSDTVWQSDGRSGQHWIRLHVAPNTIVTRLTMLINANDGNYCPSLVDVFTGDVAADLRKLCTVALSPTGLQQCVLLDKVSVSHRIVQVNIRENNGGCDCKVRGIFLSGHPSVDAQPQQHASLRSSLILQDLLSSALAVCWGGGATFRGEGVPIMTQDMPSWIATLSELLQEASLTQLTRVRATWLLLALCRSLGTDGVATQETAALHVPVQDEFANLGSDGRLVDSAGRGDGQGPHAHSSSDSVVTDAGGVPMLVRRHVVETLLHVLAHSSDLCFAMEPMNPALRVPLPELHQAVRAACVQLLEHTAWRGCLTQALHRAMAATAAQYSPPPQLPSHVAQSPALTLLQAPSAPSSVVRFDFLQVWWADLDAGIEDHEGWVQDAVDGGNGTLGHGAERHHVAGDLGLSSQHAREKGQQHRPSSKCPPRVVLYSASAPNPLRMLLNIDAAHDGGAGQAGHTHTTAYHIESFEALVQPAHDREGRQDEQHDAGSSDGGAQISSVTVALRPVFTARFNSCLCDLHIHRAEYVLQMPVYINVCINICISMKKKHIDTTRFLWKRACVRVSLSVDINTYAHNANIHARARAGINTYQSVAAARRLLGTDTQAAPCQGAPVQPRAQRSQWRAGGGSRAWRRGCAGGDCGAVAGGILAFYHFLSCSMLLCLRLLFRSLGQSLERNFSSASRCGSCLAKSLSANLCLIVFMCSTSV